MVDTMPVFVAESLDKSSSSKTFQPKYGDNVFKLQVRVYCSDDADSDLGLQIVLHGPHPPVQEDDQHMGLLCLMDVCPIRSHIMREEEGEDFEKTMENTCVLSMDLADTWRELFRC